MRKKLFLGFLAVISLIWSVCIYTIFNSNDVLEVFVDMESDIIVGAISMAEAKNEVADIKGRLLSYILRGNEERTGKTRKERLQNDWATLEEHLVKHLEHESHVGPDDQGVTEKMLDLSRRLASVSVEIVDLKDRGVGTEELKEKMQKEFKPIYLTLTDMLDEHLAIHKRELSAAENEFHVLYNKIIRSNIAITVLITLITLLIGLAVDRLFIKYITKRKQAEEALKETRDYLENLINYANAPIIVWNTKFEINRFNHAFERLTGYQENEVIGQKINILFPEEGKSKSLAKIKNTLSGEYWESVEIPILTKESEIRIVLWNSAIIYSEDDKTVIAAIAQGQDITDRKRAEEKIKGHLKRLEILNKIIIVSNKANILTVLLEDILSSTLDILDFDGGAIYLVDESAGVAEILYDKGLPPDFIEDVNMIKITDSPYNTVFIKKEPIIANSYAEINPERSKKWGILSLASIPLASKEKVIGALNVASRRKAFITSEEEEMLLSIGRETGAAIVRMRAEEALKESEKRYREVVEYIADIIYVLDGNGNFKFVNKALERSFGYRLDEILNKNLRNFITPKSYKYAEEIFRRMLAGEDVGEFEIEFYNKEGNIRITETRMQLVWEGNRVVKLHAIGRDITKRKLSEEALRESEEKYRLLFDNMLDGFAYHEIVLNDEGQPIDYIFLEINDVFEEITGVKRKDMIGKKVTEALPGTEKDDFDWIGVYGKVALTGEGATFNRYFKSLDKWFSITAYSPRRGFFATLFEEITEKRKMEEQLMSSQKMEAIGTLAGGIAHDFNNILATILGYSSFLKAKVKKGGSIYDGFSAIESSALRAAELTSQLLAYSRKGKLEVKPVNINRVVREVHDFISKTFDKSIKIKLKTKKELSTVEGDESQLNQVVMNLAINAQNAMPNGGTFKITTYSEIIKEKIGMLYYSIEPGNYVCLKFTDTGIGMDDETMKKIFEPYFTTRGDKGGTGLGMSVVYGIVKGHDGYIDIKSLPGKGTEITVYFLASKKKEDILIQEIGKTRRGTETLLVIDDEEDILVLLDGVFVDFGYKIHTSSSGKKGINIFSQNKGQIDLVILDIKMPDMSGKDILKKLLKIDPETKVLLSSGYSEEDQHHDLLEMGAVGFIGKPFIVDKLLRKIRGLLD